MSELIQLLNHNLTTEHALAVERKRWNALKKELEHRYATEGIPARKAEVDSILAEMHAAELPEPDAECECDGGCWSTQGCYRQQTSKLAVTPTEPTPLKRGGEDVTPRRGGEPTPPPVDDRNYKACDIPALEVATGLRLPLAVGRCKTCKHFDTGDSNTLTHCRKGQLVKFDGSGFCHLHTEVTK